MIPLPVINVFPVCPWGTARDNLVNTESKSGACDILKKTSNDAIIEL